MIGRHICHGDIVLYEHNETTRMNHRSIVHLDTDSFYAAVEQAAEPMKFLSLAEWTGVIETELFSKTYRSYGLATVLYPLLEIEARVKPFENGRRFTLRAMAARKPRLKKN